MGLEAGTYIDSLVAANPLGTDNRNQGDDHIRLLKSTIKSSFPDVDEAVVTIHNGSSAPSTPQTGTVWRDTSASLWKFYNGSGWITLAVAFNTSNSVDVNAGTIDGVTIGTNSACTDLRVDDIKIDSSTISSTDTNGDITITPNGTGDIILDGQKWPQADGDNLDYLSTNGSGQISWTENTVAASVATATAQAAIATTQAGISTAKAVLTAADVVSCNAVLDTFDDAFLGSKSSAPTLDNDGDALADGALYFLTTTNVMYVYDLGTTTWLQLTPTDAEQTNINVVAGNILYKEDLGSIADALTTSSGSDISTVADNIANVNSLAASAVVADMALLATTACIADMALLGDSAIITDMALLGESAVIADMALLAESAVIADMALLGDSAIITDMGLLGDSAVITDMALLAVPAVITDMDLLGASGVIANIATVSTNVANVNTVGGISANVTTVAGISANVTTVAGVSANVTTVAGSIADVNRYAAEYVIASSTPTSPTPAEGDLWYDSTNNVLKYHNGTGFISIASGIADLVSDGSPQLGAALDCQNNNINNCGTVDGSNLQMDFGSVA